MYLTGRMSGNDPLTVYSLVINFVRTEDVSVRHLESITQKNCRIEPIGYELSRYLALTVFLSAHFSSGFLSQSSNTQTLERGRVGERQSGVRQRGWEGLCG